MDNVQKAYLAINHHHKLSDFIYTTREKLSAKKINLDAVHIL
jgi:hypothetical protein